ncbi:methyl-accepting chemotaxis protein [Sphingomonas sp. LHG3406-1]|uniref:methyl-accepting chemotaxis protein n=1 Tax=Sphingomonas sp. LHG3406-1 TaxID=2804617 RepID=UPI0026149B62|nr:methyl-accepting chemotaxis protein [Sphingomonas sp. LHG3406-1]
MTIKRMIRIAATVALSTLLVCSVVFAIGINSIRIGGANDQQLQYASDLQADILPPPLFLVEATLEATRLLKNAEGREERIARLAKLQKEFRERKEFWDQPGKLDPKLKELLDGPVNEGAQEFWTIIDGEVVPAIRRGDDASAAASFSRAERAFEHHRASIHEIVTAANVHKEEVLASTDQNLQIKIGLLAFFGLLLLGGTMAAAFLLNRRVVEPLSELTEATAALAEGKQATIPHIDREDELGRLAAGFAHFRKVVEDLAEVERRDAAKKKAMVDMLADVLMRMSDGDLRKVLETEFDGDYGMIGTNLNQAILSLREMVQQVVTSASSIRQAAGEIADASSDLSNRTQSNAAAIEQTTAALTDVDRRVTSTRDAAQSTAESAERAKAAVERGLAKARTAASTMEEVREAAASVDGVMEALDKIAFQTRVLAMNAAVEAGHAGEVGKGFAVVADLVSQLAARAEEEARNAREQLTATAERIAQAVEGVCEVEVQFTDIVSDVASVTELVEKLSSDAQAQASAVAEISAAMRQMDVATQQNAAMVEQTSAAAANLLGSAGQLVANAEQFNWDRRERNQPIDHERRGRLPQSVFPTAA